MKEEMNETSSNKTSVFYNFVKRAFDIICGFIGILILIPATLVIKVISICCGDFNSIFFTQKRIGKDGREFNFYKFRSMVPNADQILYEMLENNPEIKAEYDKNKKLKDDPRITKVGKIIRRLSIDELPQLFNVLKGDMSVIGNRPYLPREKADMGEYFDEIVKSKPGITGYWQTSGRDDVTFATRLKLESYYSNHQSLKLDIKIFFKTFKAVFGGHGAAE